MTRIPRASRHLAIAALVTLACPVPRSSGAPVMGLAYQPYVGQWSQLPDNPYATDRYYTPSFNTYVGGIQVEDPAHSLLVARQRVALRFDREGRVVAIDASGSLDFKPQALRDADASDWSRTYFKFFDGKTALPAHGIDHPASVYRQLDFLRQAAHGAPLTLATYGTGFQAGYWRAIGRHDYVALPVWTDNGVDYLPANGAPPNQTRSTDEIYFYFPPTASYVRQAPERIQIETTGKAGRDLQLVAVHQTLFEPARRGDPDARLNPGFFAGDANGQIALAAAEINAKAGKAVLTIKLGVDNLAVDGSLVNDRMRFSILSALAQAQVANARFPGTVTHLILSNEYARIQPETSGRRTSTQQITAMVQYAKNQMAKGGDFAGLDLRVGARGNSFRGVDPTSTDPAIRQFSQDVAKLVTVADFLMENVYPSPEALESARKTGHWDAYFAPERGELANQWRQFQQAIGSIAAGKDIDLMIGEIGHPTNGIAFNLPGYEEGAAPITPGTAFAKVAGALDPTGARLAQTGIDTFHYYVNDRLAAAFLAQAVAWSRRTGVQIHLFEAFDEPQKSVQNPPLPGLTLGQSSLNRAGPYGAEGFYGLFGYTGVAAYHVGHAGNRGPTPGSRLASNLPTGARWAEPFAGRLYTKLPGLDFAKLAGSFEPVKAP